MSEQKQLTLECPLPVKCGYGITDHQLLVIEPGLMQVNCPSGGDQ